MAGSKPGLASTHTKACFGLMNVLSFFSAEQSGGRGWREGEVAGELWEGVSNSQPDCLNSPQAESGGPAGPGATGASPTGRDFPSPLSPGRLFGRSGTRQDRSVSAASPMPTTGMPKVGLGSGGDGGIPAEAHPCSREIPLPLPFQPCSCSTISPARCPSTTSA